MNKAAPSLRGIAAMATRWPAAFSACVLVACGGGGGLGGDTTVKLTVDFSYAQTDSDMQVPLRVAPALSGLQGHAPVCRISSGSLPPGVTLDASSCAASGTPTAAGPFFAVVTLTPNNVEGSVTAGLSLRIADPTPVLVKAAGLVSPALAPPDLVFDYGTPQPPRAVVSISPTSYVAKPGDTITYAIVGGALPSGISFDGVNGTVQGTPTGFTGTTAQIAATLTRNGVSYRTPAIDLGFGVASLALQLTYPSTCITPVATTITCTPQFGIPAAFNGLVLSYSATGLPAGLRIEPSTGVISGPLLDVVSITASVTAHAVYPNGSSQDLGTTALLRSAGVAPIYNPDPANVGVSVGPMPGGLIAYTAELQSGVAFELHKTAFTVPLPGDAYAFALLPYDATTPLPPWLGIDPVSGLLFGIAPTYPAAAGMASIQLTTTRGGRDYLSKQSIVLTIAP